MKHLTRIQHNRPVVVAPCAGAWIETYRPLVDFPRDSGRPLRGGVD